MHWNLFSVLESDLANVSRYIEFDERNYDTFSTELSKLLLSVSSEVDVVLKQLCKLVSPDKARKNFIDYFQVIESDSKFKKILEEEVFVPRFNLSFQPFDGWDGEVRPKWWKSYNNVKHNRQLNYPEACLKNVLLATSALMLCVFYLEKLATPERTPKEITSKFQPDTQLLKLRSDYYYDTVVV